MRLTTVVFIVAAPALLVTLPGCEEKGTGEKAGEKVDEAVEETGEAIEEAGDEIKDATDPD